MSRDDRKLPITLSHFLEVIMGKLNIAHHKSYHPYRRDNIERVRRDEEEARLKEATSEGRILLAVRGTTTHPTSETQISDSLYRMQRHG